MAKRGPHQRKRIPKFCFTTAKSIGNYVMYRDPIIGTPRKHQFGIKQKDRIAEAQLAYRK
ncbi:hypothetical protein MNBD_PLANCTO03-527 [hydrothermal vent metagenome]|uniref:Uncharacterized protein n=1 Tax=hydrothermal vent metagenome TaxID=652676 RepID=A0A3B1DIX5_9ZZZZ